MMEWFDKLKRQQAQKTVSLIEQYRVLLRAAIAGKLNEAKLEELGDVAGRLGFDDAKIQEHAKALEEYEAASKEAAGADAIQQQIEQVRQKHLELVDQLAQVQKDYEAKILAVRRPLEQLEGERIRLSGKAQQAEIVRGNYPELFAQAEASPTSAPPLSTRAEATRDLLSREISVRAATADDATMSIDVVLATENPVKVMDWQRGVIDEILIAGGGVFNGQLPLLNNHERTLEATLGTVRDIRRDGATWVGRAYFAAGDEAAQAAWNKVRQGVLTDVSVGYRVLDYVDIPAGSRQTIDGRTYDAGDLPMRISRRWEAKELSLVPIGADTAAKTRAVFSEFTDGGAPIARGGYASPMIQADADGQLDPVTRSLLTLNGLRKEADLYEAESYMRGLSSNHLRESAAALAAGLILRSGLRVENERLASAGNRWARESLPGICQQIMRLEYRGEMKPWDAVRTAVTGGTLTNILTSVANAALVAAWEDELDTSAGWCAERDASDFKRIDAVGLEYDARPRPLPRGKAADHVGGEAPIESYRVIRLARQWFVDEQDIQDDRIDALLDLPDSVGREAKRVRPDLVMSILLANEALDADSVALFHADHGNLVSGGGTALAASSVKTALASMLKQLVNKRVSNIRGLYLLVPGELAGTAREIARTMELANAQDNLIVYPDARIGADGVIDPLTDTKYTGTATNWFMAARAGKTIEVAYRLGTNRRPVLTSWTGKGGQWGVGFGMTLDIGAKALDFRGLFKSVGA